MNDLNYEVVFEKMVNYTIRYLETHKLKAMVLGISGGIDSTVVAAICREVSKRTGIPLIGRSLPIKNKNDEFDVSKLVGEAFCDEFHVRNLRLSYKASLIDSILEIDTTSQDSHEGELMMTYTIGQLENWSGRTPIANGNLQARCRMQHLYDLASRNKGLVMSTDNQTEYQLGFWTLHGDVGDFDPIQGLWKTEVYKLAEYLFYKYDAEIRMGDGHYVPSNLSARMSAIKASIALTPTDGLGISNSDLEQIGAKDYATVDDILSRFIPFETFRKSYKSTGQMLHPHDQMAESDCWSQLCERHGEEVVNKVWDRHVASEFKRARSPITIPRSHYDN